MDKRRHGTLKKYGISQKRYKELKGFCEQYPEFLQELRNDVISPKTQVITGMPFSKTNAKVDETANIAIRRAMMEEKVKLIEETAQEASPDLWEYIIKSACYEQSFYYLQSVAEIPISYSAFFDARRYFFYLLDQRKM